MKSPYICPGCGTAMTPSVDPDLTVDVCPSCGGTFLDKGELNEVATGMAGDIEYCSMDPEFDSRYRVLGCREAQASSLLPPGFRQAAVSWSREKPRVISRPGILEVSANGIFYSEGPYQGGNLPNFTGRSDALVKRLLEMTEHLDPGSSS